MKLEAPDKKNKLKVLGKKVFSQQNEILGKYFILDNDKGVATIEFHYDHFEDFLDQNLGNGKARFFTTDFKEKLRGIVQLIPLVYDVNIIFNIKDYDGYTIEDANQILEDNMNIHYFNNRIGLQKKKRSAIALLIIGILFLISNILFNYFIEGTGTNKLLINVFSEIMDIAAWVFVWESVSIYFIDRAEMAVKTEKFRARIKEVVFKKPKDYLPVNNIKALEEDIRDSKSKEKEEK
ncbi:MAG: hypothetical protein WCS80_00725 [Bacilli bacterium]